MAHNIMDGSWETINIEFILRHFPEPIFPRTISTFKSMGKQFEVFNKEEITKAYEDSNFIDCRVNAYPSYTEYKGIQRYPPNFIFADLDLSLFSSRRTMERSLSKILRTIWVKINGRPTVLWTGNGFHIYQPIQSVVLEQLIEFKMFANPSIKFIRFAERYLTAGAADPSHAPSFKSCMIRIPGSLNSKCQEGQNRVKIIKEWDGYRPSSKLMWGSFHSDLVDQKIKEIKLWKRVKKGFCKTDNLVQFSIPWIDTLLETPIHDYRKNAVGLILAPYLINIKKMPYDNAFMILTDWLKKCNELRPLDSNFDNRLRYSLNSAARKFQLPLRFGTLENKNKDLHELLRGNMYGNK